VTGARSNFTTPFKKLGVIEQDQPREYCYIKEPIFLSEGDKQAYVLPYHGLRLSVTIDFPHPAIGMQKIDIDVNESSYRT
jgi:UDP-3-O-[3-hydroxymyristoyl] N-acetylglucosamine deacetylase